MGRDADPEIVAFFGLYEDEKLQAFIDEKGKEMAAVSHRPNLPYEFKIVDSPVINAFAVPGGYVYFTRGILAYFNSEAEFAGVLGHEIGHITARHSVIQQRNTLVGQIGLLAGIILVPELAQFAEPLSAGLQLAFLKFGRDAERQSDELGVEYAARIGYDPSPMAEFFDMLDRKQAEDGVDVPTFLSTHPSPSERSGTVKRLAQDWKQQLGKESYAINRNEYLRRIEGLIYGEDPRQGFVEGNAFYHPELKFQFPVPNAWKLQNSPSQVQMSSEDGKGVMVFSIAQENTPSAAGAAFAQRYGLTVTNRREVKINGFDTEILVAEQSKDNQVVIRLVAYHIAYDGKIYRFFGASAPADFSRFNSIFTNTMDGFRQLTDQSKLNKQPLRINIVQTTRAGRASEILTSFGVSSNQLDEICSLNGILPSDQLQSGMLLKLVK